MHVSDDLQAVLQHLRAPGGVELGEEAFARIRRAFLRNLTPDEIHHEERLPEQGRVGFVANEAGQWNTARLMQRLHDLVLQSNFDIAGRVVRMIGRLTRIDGGVGGLDPGDDATLVHTALRVREVDEPGLG
jgi:hypothetical protein